MKKQFTFLIFWTIFSFSGYSQDYTQTVKGRVVDAVLDIPLPGANISYRINDSLIGTSSDMNGEFRLENVPVGRHTFKITMMGYEEQTIQNVLISSGKETNLTIRMTESVIEMEAVVVTANGDKRETNNQMATVSARSFSVEETKRIAGSFDDPARMAQSFAGVSSNDDSSNEIVIRGNSPRGVLWKLEGIEIPNPNHFSDQGASGGAISMLSSNMMTNSDFFTGAFPGEYGNALSGVFDISLRKGNKDKREYAFQAGVLGVDFAAEGYFKKGYAGSYLINYRYSTLSLLNTIGIKIAGDAVPVFQDLCFNINLPSQKLGNFTFFGLGGISSINDQWENPGVIFRDGYKVKMGVAGLTHTYMLTKNSFLKTIVSYNTNRNNYQRDLYDSLDVHQYLDYRQNFINEGFRGTITYNAKLDAKNTIKAGVIYSILQFDYFSKSFREEDNAYITFLDQKGSSGIFQSFVSWKHRFNEKLTLMSGVHQTYFLLNKSQMIEPRVGLKWQMNNRHSLNIGGGMHSRIEDITIYMAQNTLGDGSIAYPNRNLNPTKAVHGVIGYDIMISENAKLRAETYYQYLFDVPVISTGNSYFSALNYAGGYTTDSLTNKGTGTNYGVDITLERYFIDSWFFMLTASIYQSTYTDAYDRTFNTRYNGNYATTLVGGKEFKCGKGKNNIFSVTTRANWAGGRRFTPILLNESIAASWEIEDENHVFEDRQKDYMRLDLQISFKRNKKKTTRTWKIDMQNITNRQNIYGQYFDSDAGDIRTSYQMGFIPILSYKVEF